MKRTVSVTGKWGRVTTYRTDEDVAGYAIFADNVGEPGTFTVCTHRRTASGRLCGPSFVAHGRVAGGPGVAERIMAAGRAAIAAGLARGSHDPASCSVCTPAATRAS